MLVGMPIGMKADRKPAGRRVGRLIAVEADTHAAETSQGKECCCIFDSML